ncbi:MAG TPA: isoaspartyl peptidase/L-asparaginase, partial [Kofleriaceae bacterium]|nr:isoaspartyl peptidase/L-asparaginase [Kofleriaceae bacterium]
MLARTAVVAALLLTGCTDHATAPPAPHMAWGLVLHGGAGVITRDKLTPEREAAIRVDLERALRAAHAVIARGGKSSDAVTAAITILEDSPLFNAGKGAVFTHDGINELDAAIMDGRAHT